MDHILTKPCARWTASLAARHPSDLSAEESAALSLHLEDCQACALANAAYMSMEASLRQLPPVAPLEQLSVLQYVEETVEFQRERASRLALADWGRWERLQGLQPIQIVSLLAALLVVFVLVSDSLTFFASSHQAKSMPTVASPSSAACQAESALDSSLARLCTAGLMTEVNLSQSIDDYVVTLGNAYMDSNQLWFDYSTSQHPDDNVSVFQLETLDVTMQTSSGSIVLDSLQEHVEYFSLMEEPTRLLTMISVPNTGSFPQKPQSLGLKLTLSFLPLLQKSTIGHSTPARVSLLPLLASFSFQLDYRLGNTLAELSPTNGGYSGSQKVNVNGVVLTLFKTVVSQSMVAFYVDVPGTLVLVRSYSFSLSFQEKSIKGFSMASIPRVLPENQSSYYVFSMLTSDVYGEHGTLVLNIAFVNALAGPWIFSTEI